MTRSRIGITAAVMVVWMSAARADLVETSSGRTIQGRIVSQDGDAVWIDTMADGRRVKLFVMRNTVVKITRAAVPETFFEPVADARLSKEAKPDEEHYLEVPVVGTLGRDVLAEGIRRVFLYSKTHHIEHIVFVIDSVGTDLDEAKAISRIFQGNAKGFKTHAVIKKCLGAALVFPVWCDDVRMMPGGEIGGAMELAGADGTALSSVQRAQLARRVSDHVTARRGAGPAQLIAAMIDPKLEFVAWKSSDGEVHAGRMAPKGANVLFQDGPDTVVKLSSAQFESMGGKLFSGSAAELGKELEISNWRFESDYGRIAMEAAAEALVQKQAQLASKLEIAVRKNLDRREDIEESIGADMREASKWDPSKGKYTIYENHYGGGWGWGGGGSAGNLQYAKFTDESAKDWTNRTDACAFYVNRALTAARNAKQLDEEAGRLGLAPTFKKGELDRMITDMQIKLDYLKINRFKTGS